MALPYQAVYRRLCLQSKLRRHDLQALQQSPDIPKNMHSVMVSFRAHSLNLRPICASAAR